MKLYANEQVCVTHIPVFIKLSVSMCLLVCASVRACLNDHMSYNGTIVWHGNPNEKRKNNNNTEHTFTTHKKKRSMKHENATKEKTAHWIRLKGEKKSTQRKIWSYSSTVKHMCKFLWVNEKGVCTHIWFLVGYNHYSKTRRVFGMLAFLWTISMLSVNNSSSTEGNYCCAIVNLFD